MAVAARTAATAALVAGGAAATASLASETARATAAAAAAAGVPAVLDQMHVSANQASRRLGRQAGAKRQMASISCAITQRLHLLCTLHSLKTTQRDPPHRLALRPKAATHGWSDQQYQATTRCRHLQQLRPLRPPGQRSALPWQRQWRMPRLRCRPGHARQQTPPRQKAALRLQRQLPLRRRRQRRLHLRPPESQLTPPGPAHQQA